MFTQAASREAFVDRLNAIKSGIEQGKYCDNTLGMHTKFGAMFCLRRIITFLTGRDLFVQFRANAVAQAIVEYTKVNKKLLDQATVDTTVYGLLDTLSGKVRRVEQKALIVDIKGQLSTLFTRLDPQSSEVEGDGETDEEVASSRSSRSRSASQTASTGEVAAAANIVAEAVQAPPALPAALVTPTSTSVKLEEHLSQEVRKASQNLAYGINLELAKTPGSYSFSPVGVMDMLAIALATSGKEITQDFLVKYGLSNAALPLEQFASLRKIAPNANVVLDAAYATKEFAVSDQDKAKLEAAQVKVHESLNNVSARQKVNVWMKAATGRTDEMLDSSYSKQWNPKLTSSLLSVLKVTPEVKMAHNAALVGSHFSCADKTIAQVPFYGYENLKAVEMDDFKMVVVTYKSNEGEPTLQKVIMMPNEGADLKAFTKKLDKPYLDRCLANYATQDGIANASVYLPRLDFVSDQTELAVRPPKGPQALGQKVSAWIQSTVLQEKMQPLEASASSKPAFCKFDRPFFYFVMNGDDVLIQGRVDDAKAIGL